MDQLTAYRILGLKQGCSPEEVKEAYASLSKQYHPEEEPEKFQEIHEAYITLTRRKRRGTVQMTYDELPVETLVEKHTFDFESFEMTQEEEVQPIQQTYCFEDAVEKAEREEREKLHELVLEAAAELKVLVSPKYRNNLKAFKKFFADNKYEAIIRRADFLEKLCDTLENSKLDKNIYNYIIEFYRLRGRNLNDLSEVGVRLYKILEGRVGMKPPVNPGIYAGLFGGLFAGFRALRPVIRQFDFLAFIGLAVLVIPFVILGIKKLRERSSVLFTQFVASIILAFSQFIVIMFDLYGTIFGSLEDGNSVAAVIFLIAIAWLIIVVFVALVKFVANLFKKN